ncbi:MAG: methylenetetrahydrofolate reductase [Gaiellales bacterium]|nr:methylenetetrahydrofolate reductase [Gaiellales bacterium]
MTEHVTERLRHLAAMASVEVTPKAARDLGEIGEALPAGTTVYITALPGSELDELIGGAKAVRDAGHVPVPHLPARAISGPDVLDRLLGRLREGADVDDVLVIAGSVKSQVGEWSSSMDVLRSGLLERHGIVRAGVAGHPEGSPDIPPEVARAAVVEKNRHAEQSPIDFRIVTQFAFAAEPYLTYERELREAGNRLPVIAGLPGVTSPPALLKYGIACGIGPSMEILRKQAGGLIKLATTRHWKPDDIARDLAAATAADPEILIRGIHLFPFGGLQRSAEWLSETRAAAGLPA